MDYTVIDFETATPLRSSACALGLIRIENDIEVFRKHWLIKPTPFEFSRYNIQIHGITPSDCESAPTFDSIYPEIEPYIRDQILVAHNAAFDTKVLCSSLDECGISAPHFYFLCTYKMAQVLYPEKTIYRLPALCEEFGIPLEHHNPMSDANACLSLFRVMSQGFSSFQDICQSTNLRLGSRFYSASDVYIPSLGEFIRFVSHDSLNQCYVKGSSHKKSETESVSFESFPTPEFIDKCFVFTGTLLSMKRDTAHKIVEACGGKPQASVTNTTNYLVVGTQDIYKFHGSSESSKMRSVQQRKSKGQDITIIDEDEFLSMVPDQILHVVSDS